MIKNELGAFMKLAPLTMILAMLIAAGCDTARDARKTRFNYSPFSSNTGTTGGNQTDGDGDLTIGDGSGSGSSGNTTTIPSEISHCSWAQDGLNGFSSNSTHLGQFTVCKSTSSETDLYIQIKNPITSVQVCLVPMSTSGSSSVYIGEPRCLVLSDNKRVYKVTMLKNRTYYSHLALNGVMIMKDEAHQYPYPFNQYILSPDAFIFCSEYLAQHGYDGYCDTFKDVGAYVYKQF